MTDLTGKTIGIIGLGQIGGSLALALRKSGVQFEIVGFDREESLAIEAVNRAFLDRKTEAVGETIEVADIVILALPISGIVETILEQAGNLKSKLLVTDVGSLMTDIARAAEAAGLRNFVSGHPIAGTEKRGREAWDETLFEGCRYFLTPSPGTTVDARRTMEELITSVGAEPIETTADNHDLAFATTSNLVHLLAFCLKQAHDSLADEISGHDRFAGPSFRSVTRVAASDPEMVFQMLWHNRRYLAGALRNLSGELEMAHEALTNDGPDLIRRLLGRD